jgi:hypothetical protein
VPATGEAIGASGATVSIVYAKDVVEEFPAPSQARAYIVEVVATDIAPVYKVPAEQSAGVLDVE